MAAGGEVYILDNTLKALGMIDDAESIIWNERYYDTGSIEIYAPATERNVSLLKIDNVAYIFSSDSPAVIQDISMEETEQGVMIIATGISADGMLDRRVYESLHMLSGSLSKVIDNVLNSYAFNPLDEKRAFYNREKTTSISGVSLTVENDCKTYISSIRGNSVKVSAGIAYSNNGDIYSLGEKNGDSMPYHLDMYTNSGASMSLQISHKLRSLNESIYDELLLDHVAQKAYVRRRVGYKMITDADLQLVKSMNYNETVGSEERYYYNSQYKLNTPLNDAQVGSMIMHQNLIYASGYKSIVSDPNQGDNDMIGPVLSDHSCCLMKRRIQVSGATFGDTDATGVILYQLANEYTEEIDWIDIPDYFNSYGITPNHTKLSSYLTGFYLSKASAEANPFIKGNSLGVTDTIDSQVTGDKVGEHLRGLLKEHGAGLRARLTDTRNKIILEPYIGTNRSYDQTSNPYIVFSSGNENLDNSTYVVKGSDEINFAYTAGEGEGYLRTIVSTGEGSGWSRKEAFIDARDLSSEIEEGVQLTPEQYKAVLEARGRQNLKKVKDDLTGTVNLLVNYTYNRDFFLGDIVTIENRVLGIYTNKRIVEISQAWDATGYSIDPVFGD